MLKFIKKRSKCYWLNDDLIEQPKLHLNQKMMTPLNFLQFVTLSTIFWFKSKDLSAECILRYGRE